MQRLEIDRYGGEKEIIIKINKRHKGSRREIGKRDLQRVDKIKINRNINQRGGDGQVKEIERCMKAGGDRDVGNEKLSKRERASEKERERKR